MRQGAERSNIKMYLMHSGEEPFEHEPPIKESRLDFAERLYGKSFREETEIVREFHKLSLKLDMVEDGLTVYRRGLNSEIANEREQAERLVAYEEKRAQALVEKLEELRPQVLEYLRSIPINWAAVFDDSDAGWVVKPSWLDDFEGDLVVFDERREIAKALSFTGGGLL